MGILDKISSAFTLKKENFIFNETVSDPFDPMRHGSVNEAIKQSSKVSDLNYNGYQYVIQPEVPFRTAYKYYTTIGKVQNVVDSFVAAILARDWYFDGNETAVKQAEQWDDDFNEATTRLIENMVRDWLICGNNMIGTTDWMPVPLNTIVGMRRDDYGKPTKYIVAVNGKWEDLPLDIDQYIHSKYIEINRAPWGIGSFHSLMTSFEYEGSASQPFLDLYRKHMQNLAKIEDKYASPIVVWAYENITEEAYRKQRDALLNMKPGDRRITNRAPTLLTETIDGRGGLIGTITPVMDAELESGLQSSAIREITNPSAMADARVAKARDDVRLLGLMKRIERIFNVEVLPRVFKKPAPPVNFAWGAIDDFEIVMPAGLVDALGLGLVSVAEGREILKSRGWKLDDVLYNTEQQQKQQMQQQQQQLSQQIAQKNLRQLEMQEKTEENKLLASELLRKKMEEMRKKQ